ncbi:MAG: DUF378 domain-containing protein [Candidatus Doudnabacteria bacterium]|nr:DUF378 domain-containing protein [Candidatus Doudnabacteria bacterium]
MKALHMIAWILVIIGGLNWLLVGIFGKDLFGFLGMDMRSALPMIVYILVGLSAIYELFTHKTNCKMCGTSSNPGMPKPTM